VPPATAASTAAAAASRAELALDKRIGRSFGRRGGGHADDNRMCRRE
jgi:hypothetical protein